MCLLCFLHFGVGLGGLCDWLWSLLGGFLRLVCRLPSCRPCRLPPAPAPPPRKAPPPSLDSISRVRFIGRFSSQPPATQAGIIMAT
ncbi:hypothetical protein BRADI_2g38833v3 [Brachypodium distachyon]|uniref:Uncharacterized protein n=1 Tax=Brachypodium distachyon TaxID=15368 RepID=A0A2K2DCN3_BRADI|nr:hypothetical protein BRADI_2g38833v3 [Brachypodium distachyon]